MLRTYDPKQVSLIYGGQIVTGFAEGSFITVERNEDSANIQVGAQGDTTRTVSNNKSGRITVVLQQTSPSNAVFDAQRIAMELSGAGVASLLGKDNGSGDKWAGAKTWPVKPPPMGYAAETSNREWILETDDLQMTIAGQLA